MFKVSFKETPKNPSKAVTKMGNKTTVLLQGTCNLPDFWKYIPKEVLKWVKGQKHVEVYEDILSNQLIIYAQGIAKRHPEDKYDTVFGERMAESRAKEHIYQFFFGLCKRLFDYYCKILYGNTNLVVAKGTDSSLEKAVTKYSELLIHEKDHQIILLQDKINGKQ